MYVDDTKLAGKKQNIDSMWKILMKHVDVGEPTSFFDHVHLGCTQSKISAGAMENYLFPANLMRIFPHGPMTWEVKQRSAWKDIANRRSKQLNSYAKSPHHAWMTTNLKKEKMSQ